jgi:predicted transcriptional regulator
MDNQQNNSAISSVHIPLALIALSICFLFFLQIKGSNTSYETMSWQSVNADKQIANLKDSHDKLLKAIDERKTLVQTSEQTQKQFTDLMKDLDELARSGDKDAKQIIAAFGIKVNEPAGATTPPDKKEEPKTPEKEKKTP